MAQQAQPSAQHVVCIGSVLWDVIGRAGDHMRPGADVPGRITRLPGGVAMNIAMTLARFGLRPILLSVIGKDPEGAALIDACEALGLDSRHIYRPDDLPTDRYMAIEAENGLIAAIADAHSLEAAGDRILRPLQDGSLGSARAPFAGIAALDGNLTAELLQHIATGPELAAADLRLAPASPGKAERLSPFVAGGRGTVYVNLEEAGLLCQRRFSRSCDAAEALLQRGAARVLVTDGGRDASEGHAGQVRSLAPPQVPVKRVTGAGDTFMAAHIAAEAGAEPPAAAFERALAAAATYVSGEIPQ